MFSFKILLVEDHPRWQKILKEDIQGALDKLSYIGEITTAHTYDEANELLQENQWHLLVTDVGLGNPSESLQRMGTRLVKQAHTYHIPAIAVSGTPHLETQDVRELFKQAGASDFFSKRRFDDDEFIEAVQNILQASHRETTIEKILVLAANVEKRWQSYLNQEVRNIAEGLQRAQKREQFILEYRWAVQPKDIRRALLDLDPQIVHFSGHGTAEAGLVFEDETGAAKLVSSDALAELFKLFANKITCVVLNGCYSARQAEAIAQHIPYVIGITQTIDDKSAIEFVVGFYDALGSGRSIEFAYDYGCTTLRMLGISEEHFPQLVQNTRVTV